MKRGKFSLLCLLMFLSSFAWAQSKDEQQINSRLQGQEDCWNKGDMGCYMNYYAPVDSVRMIYGGGIVYGKENILAFYQKYWPKEKMGQLKLDQRTIELLSDKEAFVTARFTVSYPSGKSVSGRFSGIMKKINGLWYLYTDHSA